MREKNISIADLSSDSGVSWPTINNIVRDVTPNPQKATKERIAAALHTPIPQSVEKASSEETSISGIGDLVDFDPHANEDLPQLPGVYVFYDIAGRPLYIGRSRNIRSRVRSHSDKFWFKKPLVETGAFVHIPSEEDQKQVEEILIRFLKNNAVLNKNNVDRR